MITKENNLSKPTVYGLVLAGGKSQRMGADKGAIQWHGKEQRYYMADLLGALCADVFISCREGQELEIDAAYKTLTDSYPGKGPYGAILSAQRQLPDVAWLVIACDLPLMDAATLQHLLQNRDNSCIATTFKSPHDGLPEPLITIWEPRSHEVLLSFLAAGYSCPRKVLIKNETQVKMINAPDEQALMNANTPEDAAIARELLLLKN